MNTINELTIYGNVYQVEDGRVDELKAQVESNTQAIEELKAANNNPDAPATHTISIKGRYISNPVDVDEGSDPYYNDFDFSFKVNADTSKPFTIDTIPNGTYPATGKASVDDGMYYNGKASEVVVADTYFIIKVVESDQGDCDCNCSRAELAPYFTDTVGAAGEEAKAYEHTIKVNGSYDPDDSGEYWNECDFQFVVTNDSSEAFESLIDIPEGEYPASGTFYHASMSNTYDVSKVKIWHMWDSDEHEISIHTLDRDIEWTQLYRLPSYDETIKEISVVVPPSDNTGMKLYRHRVLVRASYRPEEEGDGTYFDAQLITYSTKQYQDFDFKYFDNSAYPVAGGSGYNSDNGETMNPFEVCITDDYLTVKYFNDEGRINEFTFYRNEHGYSISFAGNGSVEV